MYRRTTIPLVISLLALSLVAARAQQGFAEFLADRWWIWLVALSLILLVGFFLVLGADWTEGGRQSEDETDKS